MSKKYLDKILLLCTPPQRDMFARMYPEGPTPSQIKTAVRQVENTLLGLNSRVECLRNVKEEFDVYKTETTKLLKESVDVLKQYRDDLIEAEKEIYQLSNPIALNNAEIQQRLDKLDALEMAGVDNWDGCTT